MSIKTPGKKHGDTAQVKDVVYGDVFTDQWPLDPAFLYLRADQAVADDVNAVNLATGCLTEWYHAGMVRLVDCKLVVKGDDADVE